MNKLLKQIDFQAMDNVFLLIDNITTKKWVDFYIQCVIIEFASKPDSRCCGNTGEESPSSVGQGAG